MEYVVPGHGFEEPEPIDLPPAPDRPSTYVLRVEIEGAEPAIWRRLVVRSDTRLDSHFTRRPPRCRTPHVRDSAALQGRLAEGQNNARA